MTPGAYDLNINKGLTFRRFISLATDGSPFSLLNCTAYSQIRATEQATDVLAVIECDILDPPGMGRLTLYLPPSVTAGLAPGRYVYDVILVFANGDREPLLTGKVVVHATITQIP